MARERGSVIWFDPVKGFGFLKRHNAGDVFCHWSAIQSDDKYKQLHAEDQVEFEVVKGDKGLPQAADVVLVRAATAA